jgi:hypothetical protein
MGILGQVLGLCVYKSSEGLAFHQRMSCTQAARFAARPKNQRVSVNPPSGESVVPVM